MAKVNKRKRVKRHRSFAEKVMIFFSILIALSMILALISSFGAGGHF